MRNLPEGTVLNIVPPSMYLMMFVATNFAGFAAGFLSDDTPSPAEISG